MIRVETTVTSEFSISLYEDRNTFADAEERVKENLKEARILSIEVEDNYYKGILTCKNYKIKVEHTLDI